MVHLLTILRRRRDVPGAALPAAAVGPSVHSPRCPNLHLSPAAITVLELVKQGSWGPSCSLWITSPHLLCSPSPHQAPRQPELLTRASIVLHGTPLGLLSLFPFCVTALLRAGSSDKGPPPALPPPEENFFYVGWLAA